MGLHERLARTGAFNTSGKAPASGFSSTHYYSQNPTSAGSFLAPVAGTGTQGKTPTSSIGTPVDTRRPYLGVGKFNVNLMGDNPTPMSPELKAKPGAFEGVPILGNIAGALGELGKVPGIASALFPGFGMQQNIQRQAAEKEIAGHEAAYISFAQQQAQTQGLEPTDWMQDTRMKVDFARQQMIGRGESKLATGLAMQYADDNLGGAAQQLFGGLNLGSQFVQRNVGGLGGDQRVKDLQTKSDVELENNPELIRIRDDLKAGRLTRDQALDDLTLAGFGVTEPIGQSKPIQTIHSIGDNTWLELPFDIAANFTSTAASLGLEIVTDPTSLLSAGTGLAVRTTAKGSAKVLTAALRKAGEDAVEEGIQRGALRVGQAGEKEVYNAGSEALRRRLGSYVPEGVEQSDMNLIRYGLKAGDPALREAMGSAGRVAKPFVSNQHVLDWMHKAENVLDPISLFGKDLLGRATNKVVAANIIDGATNSLGKHNIAPVMKLLEDAGVSQELTGGDLGTAFANVAQQVGGESVARSHARLGIGVSAAERLDPVAVTDLGRDMLQRHGSDVSSLVRHKMDKLALLVVPKLGESMASAMVRERKMVADLVVKMYGIDAEAASRAVGRMNAQQLAVVRFMQYGKMADSLLNARALSISSGDAAKMGLSPEFIKRHIFLGPTQLTRGKADDLRKALAKKDIGAVRAAVEKYDLLEWNVPLSLKDDELMARVTELLDNHQRYLPAAIDPASLTPAMRAFKDQFGDSMELGVRSEEVFATGRNAANRIVSVDPFMDYVKGAEVGIGDIAPSGIVDQHVSRLLGNISGSQVVIEQNRRFAQVMSQTTGMTREQSDSMIQLIRTKATELHASTGRGLSQGELYDAAMALKLPKSVAKRITPRELQRAVFYSHEGSLGKVGLTQKFTGRIKTAEVNRFGTSVAGFTAERIYPLVRFRWNAFFQFQEGIETPVMLIARGMISPQQFSGPLTGVRAGARAAIEAPGGGRRRAFGAARQAAHEEARDIEYQTAVMMDAYAKGMRYTGDQIEMTNVMQAGSAAAAVMASGNEGRALTSLVHEGGIARIKTRGQLIAFRQQVGNDMARMLKSESPVQWDVMRAFYGGSDAETAVRWFNDLLLRNDPDSAFSAVLAHNNPAEFFRPGFLGRRTRWSQDVVMQALQGELVDDSTSWRKFRKRYLDPADTVINDRYVEERLRALGADEWYIQRTKFRLDYPTEKEFEARLTELSPGGADEAAAIMDYHRVVAADEGVDLIESLADKYAGPVMALDEHGNFKNDTLFQLIADSHEKRGMTVVPVDHPAVVIGGDMAQIGAPHMPDIGLPEPVGALAWEGHPLAQHTEMVPLSHLVGLKAGNQLSKTPKEMKALAGDIKSAGMREPIQLTYSTADRTVEVGEGNHRIAALLASVGGDRAKAANISVPVTVFRQQGPLAGTTVRGAAMDEFGYVPANLRPSDIGIGDAESASIIRHDTALRRETTIKSLTPGQQKGRTYQQARVKRAQNPELGTPALIREGGEDGRLVARNADGEVTHRIGGRKTMDEWVGELRANMTDDEMREHAQWYMDMRRGFMALNANQQEEATRLLMAFGVTQLNTSPVAGMKFMLHVSEALASGGELPTDIKALQRVAGLNGEALQRVLTTGYVTEEGMGQKLIDFVDSLIGTDGRTVPVRGPNGTWGAVAGDIWAKRDVGYIDGKMLKHLKYAYGEQYDVVAAGTKMVKNKETGELEAVANTFKFTDRKTGQTFTIDPKEVGGNPNDIEYDAIVEFYNDATDHMNRTAFLDRTDWTPASAQALGWFKAKKVFNDPTGDPLSAFSESTYSVRHEVMPTASAPLMKLYPEVAEDTSMAITGKTAPVFSDEAARLTGVRVLSQTNGVRITDGRLGSAANFEVMASPDGIRKYMASLGALAQQAKVRATRATLAKPTKVNGVRHMVEMSFPSTIAEDEMQGALKALAEDAPDFFGDADLVYRSDGTRVIRVVSNADESLPEFTARMDDTRLREFHTSVMSPQGYARGRYINPDDPMTGASAREKAINDRGKSLVDSTLAAPAELGYANRNADELADDMWQSVQPEVDEGWGGLTVDLHNGKRPKAAGANKGGGPYSTGIGTTTSLPLDVDEATFKEAVHQFIETNRGLLERDKAHIGVFRDIDHGRIDLDVNMLVDDFEDAEAVQLYLDRPGGAYDFTTGQGVYSPVFDPKWSNDVKRGYADVVEMENDWDASPKGEGYTQHLEDLPHVRGELEREGIQWGRMVWEDAYQSLAARETRAHRIGRGVSGDPNFDLSNPAGYLQSSPRGSRAAGLAAADGRRSDRLFQRTSGGHPRGAIAGAGTALSTTPVGKAPRRAQVFVHPVRKQGDTLAHEQAHDFINRYLDPSARRRAKALYAGREGTYPTQGAKSRSSTLTVDEQEWLADQFVEYLRQGPDAVAHPALVPLASYYSKTLKSTKERVAPSLTSYDAEVAKHQTELTAYEARKAAHEAKRASGLAPTAVAPSPEAATAKAQADAIRAMHTKWDNAGARNGPRMEGDLVKLEQQGVDVTDELNLLDEYTNMDKADFGDIEEFRDARSETWDELLYSLDQKAESHLEDLGLAEEVAATTGPAPAPVDIGPFTETAPVAPKKPRGKTRVRELHPDAKALFDTVDQTPAPRNAYGYDVDEQAALNWMYAAHRRADRTSKDLIHFKSDRSWLERSLNHPYFGLYPLSYMWGKILPEMVEFMAARPFGFKAPLVGLTNTHKLYQHSMQAMENDPDLRQFMTENEDAFRAIGMLVPGLPWDLPVNAPLWLRRYVEGAATNLQNDIEGKQPEGYNAWNAFVSDIDYGRIVGDTVGYAMGPAKGTETFMQYPELAAKFVGGMQQMSPEELDANPQFNPPVTRPTTPQQPPTAQPPVAPQPVSDLSPDTIAELEATLGGQYGDVASRISGGG